MAMASSSGTRCEIDVEVDGSDKDISLLDFSGESSPLDFSDEWLESGDGAKQEIMVRDEGVAARRSFSTKLFRYVGCCCSGAGFFLERSWYFSERIQRMIEKGSVSKSDVESKIESSKVHWSQVEAIKLEREQTRKTNREYFEVLKHRKYVQEGDHIVAMQCIDEDEVRKSFFSSLDSFELGEKLAEGGQAEIYTVQDMPAWVLKVFKEGSVLQELEKQWPLALLMNYQLEIKPLSSFVHSNLLGAILLRSERLGGEDRFAIWMRRCWGDLRTLIDQRMIQSHNRGPPFTPVEVRHLIEEIAFDMKRLHEQQPPILHNDLKAANVLVSGDKGNGSWDKPHVDKDGMYWIRVADFECSVGVVGTGFWRAPEILQQLKHKVPASELVFSEKCDVYSFGMTCYELVTGRIPFENFQELPREGCDLVLQGVRPELPPRLNRMIREIITSCWKGDPSERPTFEQIWQKIIRIKIKIVSILNKIKYLMIIFLNFKFSFNYYGNYMYS